MTDTNTNTKHENMLGLILGALGFIASEYENQQITEAEEVKERAEAERKLELKRAEAERDSVLFGMRFAAMGIDPFTGTPAKKIDSFFSEYNILRKNIYESISDNYNRKSRRSDILAKLGGIYLGNKYRQIRDSSKNK